MRRRALLAGALVLCGCGLLGGSAGPAVDALKTIATLAAPMLRAEAKKRDIEIDESGGICVIHPEIDIDIPGVIATCWAPEAE